MTNIYNITLATVLALGCAQASAQAIATINGKGFTEQKFKEELTILGQQSDMIKTSPEIRRRFLEHIIDNELFASEAEKVGLQKSEEFQSKLAGARRDILASIFLQQQIDKETSTAKLQKYFDANKEKFSDKEVRASHILLDKDNRSTAEEVLKKALKGEDFATLAKKHSTGPSGPKGGDLNFFKRGRMVPAFDKVAFSTPKGKVYPQLVETRFGWHIIKITDIRGGGEVSFAQKEPEIKRLRAQEIKEELTEKLRKQNHVIINDSALKAINL